MMELEALNKWLAKSSKNNQGNHKHQNNVDSNAIVISCKDLKISCNYLGLLTYHSWKGGGVFLKEEWRHQEQTGVPREILQSKHQRRDLNRLQWERTTKGEKTKQCMGNVTVLRERGSRGLDRPDEGWEGMTGTKSLNVHLQKRRGRNPWVALGGNKP